MRGDTHARLTLVVGMLVGLVPVRSWERGEIDTSTVAIRLAVAILVTWAVLMLIGRVLAGYRSGGEPSEADDDAPRRRVEDVGAAGQHATEGDG